MKKNNPHYLSTMARIRDALEELGLTHDLMSTTMATKTEKLEHTADLIDMVSAELDTHETPCCTCGLKVARNWGERQAHIELSACAMKLKKIAKIAKISQRLMDAKTTKG